MFWFFARVLVYHAGDSIRVRQNKMKMEFGSAVLALR